MENGRDEERERYLIEKFPPGHDTPYLNVPAAIMDRKDVVIAWYIPDALTPEIQVSSEYSHSLNDCIRVHMFQGDILNATKLMEEEMQNSIQSDHNGRASWRCSEGLFSDTSGELPAGCINVSPAWFQQGHEVSYQLSTSASALIL
jgi:hypothetical protein